MDQKFVSGLGNIYVNEILSSKVMPSREVKNLKTFEISEIIKNTKILKNAIKLGGSSIKDFSSENGKKGSFQQEFNVYGKEGEKCSNADCKNILSKISISNRASSIVLVVKNNRVDPNNTGIYKPLKMPNTKSAIRRVRRVKNRLKSTE